MGPLTTLLETMSHRWIHSKQLSSQTVFIMVSWICTIINIIG